MDDLIWVDFLEGQNIKWRDGESLRIYCWTQILVGLASGKEREKVKYPDRIPVSGKTPKTQEKPESRSETLVDTGFEDFQFNSEKFQKIMKNLKYWKTMFETWIDQIWIPERLNQAIP